MADTVAAADAGAPVTGSSPDAKKSKAAGSAASKKPRVKPNHPPTAEMVNNAIKTLKERGGSSLQAIKKYMTSNYKIDAEKLAPFIKKYLRSAVTSGQLIQTKGKGASGSFKLAASAKPASSSAGGVAKKSKSAADKKPKAKKAAAPAKKKSASPSKKADGKKAASSEKKKTVAAKAPKKAVGATKAAQSPKQKPTKATKSGVKKPKAPKPKKATPAKKAAATGTAKKAAASKKK